MKTTEGEGRGWMGGGGVSTLYKLTLLRKSHLQFPFSKFFSNESDLHIVNYAIMHLNLL